MKQIGKKLLVLIPMWVLTILMVLGLFIDEIIWVFRKGDMKPIFLDFFGERLESLTDWAEEE